MANEEPRPKWQREVQATVYDLMVLARELWRRVDPFKMMAAGEEDRNFRESFGCGPFVALAAWFLLIENDLISDDGTLEHLLWTPFMKVYAKTHTMKVLCGGADPTTIRKYVWQYIDALASLEPTLILWANRYKRDTGADCRWAWTL